MSKYFDENLIRQGLSVLNKDGRLMEIRTVKGKEIYSMVTKSADQVVTWLRWMEKEDPAKRKKDMLEGRNIYVTVNTLSETCYSLPQHEKMMKIGSGEGVTDPDIIRLDSLVVDFDPIRRSHISASDSEKEKAYILAKKVFAYLRSRGWADPLIADSGNGYHFRYRIALENTPENVKLIENVLKSLSLLFSNSDVDIDTGVFNPSRILKLYGTLAQKGSNTTDRPHRMSKIIYATETWEEVSRQQLQDLVDEVLSPMEEALKKPASRSKKKQQFDIYSFLSEHGVTYKEKSDRDHGTMLYLDHCVFNPDHSNGDAKIFILPNGVIGYKCWHNSCNGLHWHDARLKLDPHAYDQPENQQHNDNRTENGDQVPDQGQELEGENLLDHLTVFDAKSLMSMEFPKIFYPVEGLVPVGETVVASPPKFGKSWMMLQMGIKIAKGEDFLHFHTNKCHVLYFALEDSEQFLQDRIKKLASDDEIGDIPEDLHIVLGAGVRKINKGFLQQVDAYMNMFPGVRVVIVDTLRFIRPAPARNVSPYDHDYAVGNLLKKYADDRNIALVVVTHTTKMRYNDDDLMNISGTNGTTGAADALIVISREKRADRQALMFVDGRRIQQSRHQVVFNKERSIWEYRYEMTDDQADDEGRKKLKEYMESPIRQAVIAVAAKADDKGWRGTAGQLIEKSASYGVGIGLSKKEVGGFLSKNIGLFMQQDRIWVEVIKHGTAANLYRISEWRDADEQKEWHKADDQELTSIPELFAE